MGVNSLPIRQRRDCDLNRGPTALLRLSPAR